MLQLLFGLFFFTAAKTSNATAEANNALLKVAYNIKADSVVKLIRSTHQRSIDDQGKSLIEMDNSVYAVSIAKGLNPLCIFPCFLILQILYLPIHCFLPLIEWYNFCTLLCILRKLNFWVSRLDHSNTSSLNVEQSIGHM